MGLTIQILVPEFSFKKKVFPFTILCCNNTYNYHLRKLKPSKITLIKKLLFLLKCFSIRRFMRLVVFFFQCSMKNYAKSHSVNTPSL